MASRKLTLRSIAVLSAAGLLLTACGGGDSDDSSGGGSGSGDSSGDSGYVSLQASKPAEPLIPGRTTETAGGRMLNVLFTGLVTYDVEKGTPMMEGVAEEITSEDSINWTIKLKDGWTFHDGTPVNAESFVKAWNAVAYSENGMKASYFMSIIDGYDALQAETDSEGNIVNEATAKEMSGLQVVDDKTFTVKLKSAFRDFPTTLGYTAFFPLPEAYYEDADSFGKKPIGNGPWVAETEYSDSKGIKMTPYEDYQGEKPQIDGLEFRVYNETRTPYLDVKNNSLDIAGVPVPAISEAKEKFGDRYYERNGSAFTYIGYPTYDERFAKKEVRQALSMAIDRATITKSIFNDSMQPADDAVPPLLEGYREGACKYCKYDPAAAKSKLDEAGFDTSKPIDLWFNAGADHEQWMQAIGNLWKQDLGVDYNLKGELQYSEYLPKIEGKEATGPFRQAWFMDYPSMQNYLEPLYSESALPPNGANATFWVNEEFEAKIKEGNSAASEEEAVAAYQAADDILLEEMPLIPVMYGKMMMVHSENIDGLVADAYGNIVTQELRYAN